MRLRRVIEHVREQSWTAVGIDFAIVVVGVFVGIHVANGATSNTFAGVQIEPFAHCNSPPLS